MCTWNITGISGLDNFHIEAFHLHKICSHTTSLPLQPPEPSRAWSHTGWDSHPEQHEQTLGGQIQICWHSVCPSCYSWAQGTPGWEGLRRCCMGCISLRCCSCSNTPALSNSSMCEGWHTWLDYIEGTNYASHPNPPTCHCWHSEYHYHSDKAHQVKFLSRFL